MGVDYYAFWGIEYTEAEYLATFFTRTEDAAVQERCFHCTGMKTVAVPQYALRREWMSGNHTEGAKYTRADCFDTLPSGIEKIHHDCEVRDAKVRIPFAEGRSHRDDRPHKVITTDDMEYAQRITSLITERTGKAPTVILRTYAS